MLKTKEFTLNKQEFLLVYAPEDDVEKRLFLEYEYIGKLCNIDFYNSFSMNYKSFQTFLRKHNLIVLDQIDLQPVHKNPKYFSLIKQFTYIFKKK